MGRPPPPPPPHMQHGPYPGDRPLPPPPTLPPPPMGTPGGGPPNGASPWHSDSSAPGSSAAGGSRKRSRWDQPGGEGGGAPHSPADGGAPPPRGMMPPGFGGPGAPWPRPPGGSPPRPPSRLGLPPGEEPPSKRLAGEGAANGGPYGPGLATAPSWDVETQFAAGSYVSAAGGGGGGNLSPDVVRGGGGGQTYSPEAGGGPQQGAVQLGRPLSAAYSAPEPGELPLAGNGGMHMSPMSDDEAPAAAAPQQQQQQPPAQQPEEAAWQAEGEQEAWDSPDAGFAAYVADMVRRRVGKYAQPEHPLCISQDEAAQVGGPGAGVWQVCVCKLVLFSSWGSSPLRIPGARLYIVPSCGKTSLSGPSSPCPARSSTPRSGAKSSPRSRRRTRGGRPRACSSPLSAQSWRWVA